MDIDKVYNNFELKYRYNYATKEYNEVLFMDNGSGTVGSVTTNMTEGSFENSQTLAELKFYTSNSYNELDSTTNTLGFEAWAIRDEATANKLLQALIEWHTRRRWVLEFEANFSAILFELGDFVNVRNDEIEDQIGTASMEVKKWKLIELSPNLSTMKIKIKAIEAEIY